MKARHCIGATLPALYERPPSGINTGCLRNGHSPHCFIATIEIGSSYVRLIAMPFPETQYFRRLAGPVFTPLGGASNDAAWRAQCLSRLAGPVFTPLDGASVYAAWRGQCLSRLAGPVFTPLGGPSNDAAWRGQCLSRLAGPVFTPLGEASVYAAWRAQCLSRLAAWSFVLPPLPDKASYQSTTAQQEGDEQ